jgi:hypothetical protein
MSAVQLLPFFTTAIIFVFAVLVFRRYAQRGGLHSLIWGIGLTMYGLGTLAEALLAITYSPVMLHAWYLFGAILTPAWLGQGTVHLLVRRKKVANTLLVILIVATAIATVKIFSLPTKDALYVIGVPVSAQYKDVMPRDTFTAILLSVFALYGTVTLVGGALYSAYIFLRKRIMPQRVLGNVFIAIGGLSPALGGTLASRGMGDYLFASELIGAVLIFIGFRLATSQQPVTAPPAPAQAAPAA